MPALQVRNFPVDLYERLRECAERDHRSIAQQTIIAVERMITATDQRLNESNAAPERSEQSARPRSFDTAGERANRIRRREEAFARMDEIRWSDPVPTDEEIVATVHDGRNERETGVLEACGICDEMPTRKSDGIAQPPADEETAGRSRTIK